jgi:hypothetical protein
VAHHVRVEVVDPIDDRRRPLGAVDRPVVRVGDDRDAQPVQAAAEPGDRHVDALDARHAHRFVVTPCQQCDGDDEHRARDDP